jgi:hypothetical protein
MGGPEYGNGDQVVEQRSSVKIATTAKGDATVEVKVYDGATQEALDALREIAVRTYQQTTTAVRA